jgi:hypothetical protein
MMQTIRLGVLSGMHFDEGMFDIIKSLMYLDGMVIRANPTLCCCRTCAASLTNSRFDRLSRNGKNNGTDNEQRKKKIVIVGAGPGGLTAAMVLARRGFDVEVFEKAGVVGGRNAELTVGDFRFDLGPTFLMMKFVLDKAFEEAGEKSEDYLDFKPRPHVPPDLSRLFNGRNRAIVQR